MIYIEVDGCCRLGNWMFMYAAAISRDNNVVFCNTRDPIDRSLFEHCREVFDVPPLLTEAPVGVVDYLQKGFSYSPLPPVSPSGLRIEGTFQSEKFFDIAKVRKAFEVKPQRLNRINAKYGDWLSRPNVTAIHVRRGDYLSLPHVLPFVGSQYFKDTINRIPECNDFIVCSDDFAWCKSFFLKNFKDKNFRFAEGDGILDHIYLQATCQNNIISNSSFGWWGAWLNSHANKRVLVPSMWFGMDGPKDWSDIYFHGVEIVPNRYTFSRWIKALYCSARESAAQFVLHKLLRR